MMIDKTLTGTDFPDLDSFENELNDNKKKLDSKEEVSFDEAKELERIKELNNKRYEYVNPLRHNDFSNRKMYWSSGKEIFARLMILFSQLANIAMSVCFGIFFAGPIAEHFLTDSDAFAGAGWTVSQAITNILIIVTTVFAFLLYLPMILCRKAGSVYGWGIAYIVLGILYFIVLELFYSIMLLISGLISNIINVPTDLTIGFLVITLAIAGLVVIGGCMLVVRSDDIKRKINVED